MNAMNIYLKGDIVLTPQGFGKVAYIRMRSPNYSEIEAVSVVLDSKMWETGYTGTIFPSSEVALIEVAQ